MFGFVRGCSGLTRRRNRTNPDQTEQSRTAPSATLRPRSEIPLRPDQPVHPMRVLPGVVPHLRAHGAGDGVAARPHLPGAVCRRRQDRLGRDPKRVRYLPRLPRLRARLSERGASTARSSSKRANSLAVARDSGALSTASATRECFGVRRAWRGSGRATRCRASSAGRSPKNHRKRDCRASRTPPPGRVSKSANYHL